jgi:hypothetical protein
MPIVLFISINKIGPAKREWEGAAVLAITWLISIESSQLSHWQATCAINIFFFKILYNLINLRG